MRRLFLTLIAVLALTFSVSAQDKSFEEVEVGLYAYTENTMDDSVHQTGFYKEINGELKRDGIWKLYINGELRTEARYKDDKLETLIVDGIEYSAKDLIILRRSKGKEVVLRD
jgi:hypothetical protein